MKEKPIVKEKRHSRLIQKIVNFLHESGPKNTREILDYVNRNYRHGTHSSELGNVLSKYPKYFKKGPMDRVDGILSGGYEICTWLLNYGDEGGEQQ